MYENEKSVLIFGAGLNQCMLIKAAKDLGVTSVVLDPNPNAPSKENAEYFFKIEVTYVCI